MPADHTHEPRTDPLVEPGFQAGDPHAAYARLRAEAPVAWNETVGFWALTGYEGVMEVSTDPDRFSSTGGVLLMEIGVDYPTPPTMMHTDPPEHTVYRSLAAPAFRPSVIAAMEPGVRDRVRALLDAVRTGEPADLVPTLSVPLALRTISDLLGIPESEWERFFVWTESMIPGATDLTPEQRQAVQGEMHEFFAATIAARRDSPRDDLVSTLATSEVEGRSLDDAELMMFLDQLLVAGNETTRNLISGGLVALAEHPDEWQRLVDDPWLVRSAVEEMLRWTTPVVSFMRTTTTDTTVADTPVAAGDPVLMLYASANRDEAEFGPTAGAFDIGRDPNHHLAFGFGAHFCIGAALARLEARVVLEEILSRFDEIALAAEPVYSPSDVIAGVTSAPLAFS